MFSLKSEKGQGLVEYALILVLVAIVVFTFLAILPNINTWSVLAAVSFFLLLLGSLFFPTDPRKHLDNLVSFLRLTNERVKEWYSRQNVFVKAAFDFIFLCLYLIAILITGGGILFIYNLMVQHLF